MSTDEDKIKIFLAAGMSQEEAKSIVELLNTADKEKELKEAYEKLPSVDTEKWHEVGEVGVDAGMVWIGDPCYIMKMPHHEGAQEDPRLVSSLFRMNLKKMNNFIFITSELTQYQDRLFYSVRDFRYCNKIEFIIEPRKKLINSVRHGDLVKSKFFLNEGIMTDALAKDPWQFMINKYVL